MGLVISTQELTAVPIPTTWNLAFSRNEDFSSELLENCSPPVSAEQTASMNLDQFPFSQVATWLTEGSVIPFLGSGAARIGVEGTARLPDGQGLALELITQMGGAYPGKNHEELAKVAQFYEQAIGSARAHRSGSTLVSSGSSR